MKTKKRYILALILSVCFYAPLLYLFFYSPQKPRYVPLDLGKIDIKNQPISPKSTKTKKSPPKTQVTSKKSPSQKSSQSHPLPKKLYGDSGKRVEKKQSPFLSHDELDDFFGKQYSYEEQDALDLYGQSYDNLSKKERIFIKNHLSDIGRITQRYLKYPAIAGRLGVSGLNRVEFFLYPNGDISEIRLLRGSSYSILDENTIQTIRHAYKDYPHPDEKTRIRIEVRYILQ